MAIRLCHIECRLTVTETYLIEHASTQYGDRTIIKLKCKLMSVTSTQPLREGMYTNNSKGR